MSFTATSMGFPQMLYAQLVRGLSPTEAALLLVPMAAVSIVMAPIVGRFTDRVHPRVLTGFGFAFTTAAILWLSQVMTPDSATWEILLPMALLGFGMAGVWAPLAATATRNLPLRMAGAGAGVYNATRQVGAVLGSAAIAVLMDSRIAAQGMAAGASGEVTTGPLPAPFHVPFSEAMAQSMLLPAAVLVLGLVSVMFFVLPRHLTTPVPSTEAASETPTPAT
jgi:MFS family permease